MNRKLTILLVVLFALAQAACKRPEGDNPDGKPVLVVSLEPQRYLLEQLAGDDFRVVTIMPDGDNPETFEPSVARRMDVDRCAAYFTIGYLPFERTIAKSVRDTSVIVNTSAGIEPIYGTHSHGACTGKNHRHVNEADPHVWTSVRNARSMISVMLERLKSIDPDRADVYDARYDCLDARLDSLDHAYTARLDSAGHPSFMVWHPSLSYLARDYGLRQISVVHDNKEISMSAMRDVIDKGRADSIQIFFYQRDYDARQAKAIADGVGCRLVPVNPGSYDWEKELNIIIDEICRR